jgi:hypothetical protein
MSKIVHTGDNNGGDGGGRADKGKGGADKSWVAAFAPYDPMKREPLYAGAEHTCAWELTMVWQPILVVYRDMKGPYLATVAGGLFYRDMKGPCLAPVVGGLDVSGELA